MRRSISTKNKDVHADGDGDGDDDGDDGHAATRLVIVESVFLPNFTFDWSLLGLAMDIGA